LHHFSPLWLTGESRKVNWQNSAPALVYPRWARKLHPPTILAGTPSSRTCGSAQQPRPLRCTPPIEAIANYCSIPSKQSPAIAQVADTPPERTEGQLRPHPNAVIEVISKSAKAKIAKQGKESAGKS
jgi:hypothetical protein